MIPRRPATLATPMSRRRTSKVSFDSAPFLLGIGSNGMTPTEMEDVNNSLDALSCALDAVEQRTDDIMSQLRELLNSNREIRRLIAEENDNAPESGDDNMDGQAGSEAAPK